MSESQPPPGPVPDPGGRARWEPPPAPTPGQVPQAAWASPTPSSQAPWPSTPGAVAYGQVAPAGNSGVGGLVSSLAGLVLGCMCLGIPWLIGGILGVVLGTSARRRARAAGGGQGGDGVATAAVVIGWIDIALFVLVFLVVIAFIAIGVAAGGGSFIRHPTCYGC